MLPGWLIIGASFAYLLLLFAVAYFGDRRADQGRSVIANPWVFSLSLAVYCTAWTYFGSVGRAASGGTWFLPTYLGPTLGPLASRVAGAIASDDMAHLEAMAGESHPRLVTVYGEDDRIVIYSRGDLGLGSMLGSLISAQNLGALGRAIGHAQNAGGGPIQ